MTQSRPAAPGAAAAHPDPYPYYAGLVAGRPFGRDGGGEVWVAAGAQAVREVLGDPACRVRPAAEPVPRGILGTPAGEVFGELVRMTDGPVQARRKQVLAEALATVDEERVTALAAAQARRATGWTDVQFGVPARVVATVLGLPAAEAARLVGGFVRCIPASATAEDRAAAATAAARLLDLIGPHLHSGTGGLIGELVRRTAPGEMGPLRSNVVGLLSQTYDATAGLIGSTLLALGGGLRISARHPPARHGPPEDLRAFVAEVARYDAPVQNTRRFTAATTTVAGCDVPSGATILLLLAAANRDPAANPDPHVFRPGRADPQVFTFGRGDHRCPGRALATAITVGVAAAVTGTPSHQGHRPSPNARIPVLQGQFGSTAEPTESSTGNGGVEQ
jgi:cytochrome P450